MKKTKIVCTIGPKSKSQEMLQELLKAGMNVVRLNFSHGTYEEHEKIIINLKKACDETGLKAAILLDIRGPKIRTMKLEGGKEVSLLPEHEFILTTDTKFIGNNKKVAITYEGIIRDLKPENRVLLDDGLIELEVVEVSDKEVRCTVKNGGTLGENKGVILPGVSVGLPAVGEKDTSDLIFGCKQKVDFVAASFIRKAQDVKSVRKILEENGGKKIHIISKIESQEGLDNFDEILEVSDGIMVARGDLGVEIPIEEVPLAQKMIIEKCNAAGKPVITATQMLDSMIKNPRPTRAETTDVANAILDGTDAVMLSGETANGDYPVEAVSIMTKIAERSDPELLPTNFFSSENPCLTEAIAKASVSVGELIKVPLIVTVSESGKTPRMIRKYFPTSKILAITNKEKTANQLLLSRGVTPSLIDGAGTIEEFCKIAKEKAFELNLVQHGDSMIVTFGDELFTAGATNSFRIIKLDYSNRKLYNTLAI